MTPEQLDRKADHLLDLARAMGADPNNIEVRRAYLRATFNLDWTAAAIVHLAARGVAKREAV